MSEIVTVEDREPRFRTIGSYRPNRADDDIHLRRVSAVFEDDAQAVFSHLVIKDFVDESTPHGNWSGWHALEVGADEIDDLIDALEMIRMDYLVE